MKSAASSIGLSLLLGLSGCTATCLRDSDCIGASVCLQDRCVLLTPTRDGGGAAALVNRPAPSTAEAPPPARGSSDAGRRELGSAATPTRGFLDAGADADIGAPGP